MWRNLAENVLTSYLKRWNMHVIWGKSLLRPCTRKWFFPHNELYIGNVLVCAYFSSKLAHGTYCLCSITQLFRLIWIVKIFSHVNAKTVLWWLEHVAEHVLSKKNQISPNHFNFFLNLVSSVVFYIRLKEKICLVPVTRPYLNFCPDSKLF